jgi:hypothetical protein
LVSEVDLIYIIDRQGTLNPLIDGSAIYSYEPSNRQIDP